MSWPFAVIVGASALAWKLVSGGSDVKSMGCGQREGTPTALRDPAVPACLAYLTGTNSGAR